MRNRSLGLTLFAGLSIFVAACSSGGATASPSAEPSVAPSESAAMSAEPSVAPSASTAPQSDLKIGVVTDIGTLNDKNFNEYSYKGAQQGATDIGAADPPAVVPKDAVGVREGHPGLRRPGLQRHRDRRLQPDERHDEGRQGQPDIWFIGVDQSPSASTRHGADDATFACKGDAATLLPNYISITYKEDQAGYLAGIVAAAVSKTGSIGAIGGTTLCAPCVRYIQGYELGAKSVNPNDHGQDRVRHPATSRRRPSTTSPAARPSPTIHRPPTRRST